MLARFWDYFGCVGLLSLTGWVAALALMALGFLHSRFRLLWSSAALVIAIVGLILA